MSTIRTETDQIITTSEQLDALPDKTVVLDGLVQPWQGFGDGHWLGQGDEILATSAALFYRGPEVRVLYVPGEQPVPPTTDAARAEAERRFGTTGAEAERDRLAADRDRAMQVIDHARHILAGKGARLAMLDDLLLSDEVTSLVNEWITARVERQLRDRDPAPVDYRIASNAAARGKGDSL